jgi:FkbM family methyltransferase
MQNLATEEKNKKEKDKTKRIWIDVGAHHGERTLEAAKNDPRLTVFAIEPNIKAAVDIFGCLDNYIVIPMAVSECDGFSKFYINKWEKASSLLPLNPIGAKSWNGNERLEVEKDVVVPTIRIDTFMTLMDIKEVELLKIDAQGLDYHVILSAGDRINNILKIILEVEITTTSVYQGSGKKEKIIKFMEENGFALFDIEKQSRGQEENLTFIQSSNKDKAYMDELRQQSEMLGKKKEELWNCRVKLREKREELESVKLKLREQENDLSEQIQLTKKLQLQVNALMNSTSWKLTAGLRALGNLKKHLL